MRKSIVRTDRAGVFFGEVVERNGSDVKMANVRKIWYWDGAAAVEQLALEGTLKPNNCKITVEIAEMEVLGAIQIIPCTEKAQKCLEAVKVWSL